MLIGFNATYNVFLLLTISQPVYNYTTSTVSFSYVLDDPSAAAANSGMYGFVANYYMTQSDTGVVPLTNVTKPTPLFTPTLSTQSHAPPPPAPSPRAAAPSAERATAQTSSTACGRA
jgi:hypothetical protein